MQMQLFEQGLKLVVEALRSLEKRGFQADIRLLRRIEQLRIEETALCSISNPDRECAPKISEPILRVESESPRDRNVSEQLAMLRLTVREVPPSCGVSPFRGVWSGQSSS